MSRAMPAYRLKKKSGQAFVKTVRLNDGKEIYLGVHGTPESKARYEQVIKLLGQMNKTAERLTIDPRVVTTIEMFAALYLQEAERYYVDEEGNATHDVDVIGYALQPLLTNYSQLAADDFSPQHLVAIQDQLIEAGYAQSTINDRIRRIKAGFRWACKTGLVRPSLYHDLSCVDGVRQGRRGVKERKRIAPVPLDVVKATIPWMTPVTATMVQVHFLCGMRSQDLCNMRPCDIDRSGKVWLYRPYTHKNKRRGHQRIIAIPPVAQELLEPYLDRGAEEWVFSPRESLRSMHDERRRNSKRKTKVYPCELRRREARQAAKAVKTARTVGVRYNKDSYGLAIKHGIQRAAKEGVTIPHWHPHQLRHAIATLVSSKLGPRAAQRYVGHKRLDTTKIYDSLQQTDLAEIALRVNDLLGGDADATGSNLRDRSA